MRKYTSLVTTLLLPLSLARAEAPVIDVQNLAVQLEQVVKMTEQIDTMRNQLRRAEQQYNAVTGARGLGDIFYNPTLRSALPPDYQRIYNAVSSINYSISGTIEDIRRHERQSGSVKSSQANITARSQQTAYTDKAVGLKGYESSQQRLNQIESLMKQINTTKDPKAISELQARIAVEQTAIQNENQKLQLIGQLQQAEQRLIAEQKAETNRKILNPNNTEMPKIR